MPQTERRAPNWEKLAHKYYKERKITKEELQSILESQLRFGNNWISALRYSVSLHPIGRMRIYPGRADDLMANKLLGVVHENK